MRWGRVFLTARRRFAGGVRRSVGVCGCAVLWAAPGCLPASAQGQTSGQAGSPTYFIEATLRLYSSNDPAPPLVKVELKKQSGETVATTYTREYGEFRLSVAGGVYLLVIEHEGFEPLQEKLEIRGGNRRLRLQFYLRDLIKVREAASGESSVSARELALPPKAAAALRKGREELFAKNNPAAGLEQFDKLAREAPDFPDTYYYRGVALSELGRLAEAEASLRRAIAQSEEKNVPSLVKLASLLSNQKCFAGAEPLARKSVELDATSWLAHFELARALHGMDRPEEALRAAEAARTLRPDFPKLYLVLINIHIRRGDSRGVLAAMDEYLRLVPQGAMSDTVRTQRKKLLESVSPPAGGVPPAEPLFLL